MVTIDVNTKDVIKELRKLPKDLLAKTVNQGLSFSASDLKKDIRDKVPVRSGNLRKQIRIKKMANTDLAENYDIYNTLAYTVYLHNKGFYGYFLEYGTHDKAPQPFFMQTAEDKFPVITKLVFTGIDKYIRKLNKIVGV